MGFLSGIFSNEKPATQDIYRNDVPVKVSPDNSKNEELSSVAKYINAQVDRPVAHGSYTKKLSSVAEYVQARNASLIELTSAEKDTINTRISATTERRKTEERLMSAENEELSGVARYVENQEQVCKVALAKEQAITGVAKYITNIIDTKPATTGVSKYLKNRVDVAVSSVDRYVINKSLADKNKPEAVIIEASTVSKYLEAKPTMLTSSVAKYIAKQLVSARQATA